ncbi:hypothetical protein EUTSA_v10022184mg [Eutrema salsugineum]|uniref:Gnk2-homologous domain-containing protein n=1 Tax=Eutrema salsugineum TaxID=72664 RepID=V4LV25_EUTSA|nr:hypothetical protein EUTSA_v10022184mg [Eutrema salsugineum]
MFNKNTRTLLYELKEKAISKGNNAGKIQFLYATGERSLGTKKLYALVQCTKDLLDNNCNVCLNWIMAKLTECCNGKQGGRVTDALNQTNAYLHHTCINSQGTYRPGSPYEENVNRAIKTMFKKLLDYGFIHSVVGDAPNTVYPKLQCRGDLSLSQCHSCLTTAFAGIRKRCPKNKGRIIWYENCVLEISSVYRWSQIDYQNNFFLYNAKDASGDKESFNKKTKALLYNLKEKASSKENDPYGKNYMYATMEESLGTMKLYGMVQCMKDLSVKNCSLCLDWIMAKFPKCCNGKQGGRVLCTSCNFRYELYPFVKPLVKT